MRWKARYGDSGGRGNVPPRVRTIGDGKGVDGPGVEVERHGGTWGMEGEGRR